MKKLMYLFVAGALFTACGGVDKKDPKAVTEAFVNAFANQEWDKAKEFSTKESAEMIDQIKGMMAMAPKDDKKTVAKVKSIECKEEGETCKCDVTYENEADAEKMGKSYNLKKVDGNWLVDFKKDSGLDDFGGDDMYNDNYDYDEYDYDDPEDMGEYETDEDGNPL